MSQLFRRHEVVIKRQDVTNTDSASDSKSYTIAERGALPTTWTCSVFPLKLDDRLKYMQVDQEITHKVFGLTNPQVDERDVLIFSDRTLFVATVQNPDELSRFWTVLCKEVTGAM